MKKSKLMLLYLFLLPVLLNKEGKKSFTYSQLYERLPLAESTVRGVVSFYLAKGFLEEIDTQRGRAFQVTKKGITEALELFPGLSREDEQTATILIVPPQSSATQYGIEKGMRQLGFFFLRAGVYVRFGAFDSKELTLFPRSVRSTFLSIQNCREDQLLGMDSITEGDVAREILALRTETAHYIRRLTTSREQKNFRTRTTYRSLLEKSFESIISTVTRNFRIPEEYLTHNNRMSTLNRLFWAAVI